MAGDLTKSMSALWRVLLQNMLRHLHVLLNLVPITGYGYKDHLDHKEKEIHSKISKYDLSSYMDMDVDIGMERI